MIKNLESVLYKYYALKHKYEGDTKNEKINEKVKAKK